MRKGDHLSNQLVIILMLDIYFELDSMPLAFVGILTMIVNYPGPPPPSSCFSSSYLQFS